MRLLGWLAGALGWSLIALGASHMFAFLAQVYRRWGMSDHVAERTN